jgi:hypothetical protein
VNNEISLSLGDLSYSKGEVLILVLKEKRAGEKKAG